MPKKKSRRVTRKKVVRTRKKESKLKVLCILLLMLAGIIFGFKFYQNTNKKLDYSKPDLRSYPPEVKRKIIYYPRNDTLRVPILMYHYVEFVKDKGDTIRQSLDIIPPIFANQVKTLRDAGYTFMTESELADVLDGKNNLPEKPILITFDDGYKDFFTDVFPILVKYHAKATAYIIPGFLGGSNFMNEEMVGEIVNSGLVEIADHTMNHIALKKQTKKVDESEILTAKKFLEDSYNIKVTSFAYPYGSFDDQAANVLKNSGFTSAVSTVPGISINQVDRFFMPRIRPGARTGEALLEFLENYKDPLAPQAGVGD